MNKIFLTLVSILLCSFVNAQTVMGVIVDKVTQKPVESAIVAIPGTSNYTLSLADGTFKLDKVAKDAQLYISHVLYKSLTLENYQNPDGKVTEMKIELSNNVLEMDEVTVIGKSNKESVIALSNERKFSTKAIENLGTEEMAIKGLSNAEDGVKKLTSISLNNDQLFVRGLGDRYSLTALNGLPIASPNPDNKLIPLDIFPTSTISNITVSKVYDVATFADYAGAYINIDTRKTATDDFFKVSFGTGGVIGTVFNDFLQSDRVSMFSSNNISNNVLSMNNSDFRTTVKSTDIFGTDFSIKEITAMPNLKGSVGGGKSWRVGDDELSVIASVSMDNKYSSKLDSYVSQYNKQGVRQSYFDYDSYTQELKMAALGSLGYYFDNGDRINYVLFYARNAEDNYKYRDGVDSEDIPLIGSNSTYHAYELINNQISGNETLAKRLYLNWSASYGTTSSDEPDRRQVMYRKGDDGELSLFKLNSQETMRYFGELSEDEYIGNLDLKYDFGRKNKLNVGGSYKNKHRDFNSVNFYYDLDGINPEITSVFNPNGFLNQGNIENGNIIVNRDLPASASYYARSSIAAGFVDVDYYVVPELLINLGVRFESSKQSVKYWDDASRPQESNINKNDFFPALNMKYDLNKLSSLRLSASRTVTRPSFIEMAPFTYQESYGGASVRGYEGIKNGYNLNFDLRYELFAKGSNDMVSVTGYYKHLTTPIERVQQLRGGSVEYSFRNAESGDAFGIEFEAKKSILKDLVVGVNGSYMYTNVILEAGGYYTDTQRALQGASPYLLNADVTYMPKLKDDSTLSFSLLYNYQGPRIESVGVQNMNNIIQKSFHTLDFVANYKINKHWSLSLQAENLLNSKVQYTQEVDGGIVMPIEYYFSGTELKLGVSFSL